ncbi:VOC family protein [Nocardiopsis alba]|uniref:VOC family protein n=1 Tax=Nocardiopsis alba TaxID=53437 RepID=UPI00365C52D1
MSGTARPSLIDVTGPDVEATKAFYSAVLGWRFDDGLDPTGHYSYALLDGAVVAGVRPAQPGIPPAWTLYLATEDAESTAKDVAALGGQVLYANKAPGQGYVLVLADPAGAVVGFWQPTIEWNFASGVPGSLVWSELSTPDPDASDSFYKRLTGVTQTQIGDGVDYDYSVWSPDGGQPLFGRAVQTEGAVHSHWLVHFGVDPAVGCDAVVDLATENGATVLLPPTNIPAGRLAVLADPAGATFAVIDNSTSEHS